MKRNKLSTCVFYTLIVLMILFVISTYLSSGLVARYTSSDSAFDSARVAKWEIEFTKKDGTILESIVESNHLESGSSGSWGLDISNKSEVLAQISSSSKIKICLQSPHFDINHHHDTWDFLHDVEGKTIDNPINFTIDMYNCSLEELKDNTISKKKVAVLDTSINGEDAIKFDMIIEEDNLSYEAIINVGELLDNSFLLEYNTKKICLVINWTVDEVTGATDTSKKYVSYYVIETSEYTKDKAKYKGLISKTDGLKQLENADAETENTFTFDDKNYVIAYKEHDYFDYLIYSSSVGGEVMITLTDSTEKIYTKRSTNLSEAEKQELEKRTITMCNSLESLKLYIEKLGYYSYLAFEKTQSDYNKDLGYISLGLKCRIILDLKVEQVD